MAKRIVLRVRWNRRLGMWLLLQTSPGPKLVLDTSLKKENVVWTGRRVGHRYLTNGRRAQLVIHGKNGRIQTEHTYGRDPRRSKG